MSRKYYYVNIQIQTGGDGRQMSNVLPIPFMLWQHIDRQ